VTPELRLCGPPSLVLDGSSVSWTATAPRALLALLACRAGWWTRDELVGILRPEAPEADALRYLRQLVHRARHASEAVGLEVEVDRLRWRVTSDVLRFRAGCAAGDPAALAAPVESLLAGWRPVGDAFAAWVEAERHELLRLRRRLAREVGIAREALGDPSGAADAAQVLLADDPLDEATVADVMRLRLRAGEPSAALATYEAFERRAAEEIGAAPAEETRALAVRVRQALHDEAAPGIDMWAPVAATPFVGREAELRRLARTLDGHGPQVVALVGLGGAGKTRLVFEATERARRAGHEVVFVALSGADSLDAVAERVAAALPIGWDVTGAAARWQAWVARGRGVLVLDEVEAAAGLDEWWGTVAQRLGEVRVWLTSRVAPRWATLTVWPVRGLDVPQPGAGRAEVRRSTAVRLLLERAGFDPDTVSDVDASVAGDVARALGGHPLALELAAGSVRGVPPAVAFGDLGIDLHPFRSDAADLPDRHRDLDHLLAESWRSLPLDARRAARRLTLLRGSFDLGAARAVAGIDVVGLSGLLDRALVQQVGIDRYDVHALVRRSAPPPEPGDRDAHARWALGRAAAAGQGLKGDDHAAAIAELVGLTEDARAAWTYAIDEIAVGRPSLIALLDASLEPLDHAWHTAGRLGLAAAVYRDAATRGRPPVDGVAPGVLRAWQHWWGRVVVRWSVAERILGNPEAVAAEIAALAREADGELRLEARLERAKIAQMSGRAREAEAAFRAFLHDPGHGRRPDLASAAHSGLATLLWTSAGDVAEALSHDDAALVEARRDGDPDALIVALINAGAGAFELGQDDEAERRWREAAELAERIGHGAREAAVWNNLGMLAARRGRRDAARAAFERSLDLRREAADITGQASVLLHLGQLEASGGDPAVASAHLETAVAAFDRPGWEESRAMALAAWSELASARGDPRRAVPRACDALALARPADSVRATLTALLALARAWRAAGAGADALALARHVARLARGREAALETGAERLAAELCSPATAGADVPVAGRSALEAVGDADLAGLADAVLARVREGAPVGTPLERPPGRVGPA
jgi:DNA-binding SARP family transcriptional activator/tetratricopeptide (TPR) repeat protein